MPRKSNLAIAQAAAMPKTALSGTAIAATMSVSRIADRASGLPSAATAAPTPSASASAKTADERREQDDREQREHDADEQRPNPGGLGGRRARPGAARRQGELSHRAATRR